MVLIFLSFITPLSEVCHMFLIIMSNKEVYKVDFHFTGTDNKKIALTRREWQHLNQAETLKTVSNFKVIKMNFI